MWEALAPIVRWPLYSPGRFAAVVLVALVGVFVVGEFNHDSTPPSAAAGVTSSATTVESPRPSGSSTSPSPAEDDAVATGELSLDPADSDISAAASDAAAAFVAAWARPDLDAQAWAAGVRPLATSDLWSSGLSMTDPSSTPAVTVRGEPRQMAMNDEEGVLDVPTTGAWVRVHVVPSSAGGAWLVSRVEPVD